MKVWMEDRRGMDVWKWAWSSRPSLTGVCSRRSWNGLSIDPMISTWSLKVGHRIGSWTGSRHCGTSEVDRDVDVPKRQVGG